MDPIVFESVVRYWDPAKGGGLAVADVPTDRIAAFGGLKQQRARGTLNGVVFASSVMLAGGGRLALSVSKAMLSAAKVAVGGRVSVVVEAIGRD